MVGNRTKPEVPEISEDAVYLMERIIRSQVIYAAIVGATVIIAAIVGFLGVRWLT